MPATLNNTGVLFNDSSQQSTAYLGHRVFITASSTTFTPPAGVTQLKITAVGGGGGGGGRYTSVVYAGAGACAVALVTVTGGTTYTVTVGAGGAGSNPNFTNGTGEDGENGGETWFGVNSGSKLISAGGGTGTTATFVINDPCLGNYISGASNGVDGTSSTTGTLIRSGDGISNGGLSWGFISGSARNVGLAFVTFGGQAGTVETGSTTPIVWSASSKYFPGTGGRSTTNGSYLGSQTDASAGVGGVIIIEY